MGSKRKDFHGFMFAISILLIVVGALLLIVSAFVGLEGQNEYFTIGFLLAFTGLGVFLYDIFLN